MGRLRAELGSWEGLSTSLTLSLLRETGVMATAEGCGEFFTVP